MTRYTRALCAGLILLLMLLPSACRGGGGAAVMTVGDRAIPAAEARYVLDLQVDIYEYSELFTLDWDGEIDGVPVTRRLLESARDTLIRAHVLEEKATEYGCTLSDEEQAMIDAHMESDRQAMGGADSFAAALQAEGVTEELYRRYRYEEPTLYGKLSLTLFGEGGVMEPETASLIDFYHNDMVHCLYLYLSLMDLDGFRMTGEDYDRMLAIAEGLRRQAAGGADFAAMVADDGQDYLMTLYPNGVPIVKSLYGDAFAQAADSLSPYEISPVIETRNGLYILQRLPDDDTLFDIYRFEIEDEYILREYDRLLARWMAETDTAITDDFWRLTSRRDPTK